MIFLRIGLGDHLRGNERESKIRDNRKELQKCHDRGVPAKLFRPKVACQDAQRKNTKNNRECSAGELIHSIAQGVREGHTNGMVAVLSVFYKKICIDKMA